MKTMKAKVCVMLMVMSLLSATAINGQTIQKDRPIAERIEMKTQLAGAPVVPSPTPSTAPIPSSTPAPKGSAYYLQDGLTKQFTVFIGGMGLANGTTLLVLVNGDVIGKIQLFNSEGKLELNSLRGDLIPTMNFGSSVVVTDAAGKTMLAGVF